MIFTLIILMFSCEKSVKVCNYNNPLEDLAWLKELKNSFTNCTCQITIFQATYNKQTVFYYSVNDPRCDSVPQPINLFDCAGETIKSYAPTEQTFGDEVTNSKEIYICKEK